MKRILSLACCAAILLAGCTQPFKKTKDGSEYKLIKNDKGKKAVKGNYFQMNMLVKYKDSVLLNTYEASNPRFIVFDTAQMPDFFKSVNEGDSLVIRVSTDTLIKKNQSAPFMKKGQFLYQYFKVVKVFNTKEESDVVEKTFEAGARAYANKMALEQIEKKLKDEAGQLKKDDAVIVDYLAKNNIKATKTKWGTYVAVITPGTGPVLTEKDIAQVNYTGRNLKDSVFDSNTDPKFDHVEPYDVKLNEFGVILGWIDGLKTLQKGSVAKFFIPSTLAYGKESKGANIGPDEILVFDIAVLDVLTEEKYQANQEAFQKKMMERQMKMREEMMKQQKQQAGKAPADSARRK